MTDSEDYRLFLCESFEGIRKLMAAQFINVHDKLDSIEAQTTKTNGNVSGLEDKVIALEEAFIAHPINCPQGVKIDKIRDDLEEYRVIKKYPKIAIVIIAIFAIMLAIGAYGTFQTLHSEKANRDTNAIIERIDTNTEKK
jgi:hypothetical protein